MEKIMSFFTETLSGTTYVVVVIIAVILFFACIGYLSERSITLKKKAARYASINQDNLTTPVKEEVVSPNVMEAKPDSTAINETVNLSNTPINPVPQNNDQVVNNPAFKQEVVINPPTTDTNNNQELL